MTDTSHFEFTGVSGLKYTFQVYERGGDIPPVTGIIILSKKLAFEEKEVEFQIPVAIKSTFNQIVNVKELQIEKFDVFKDVDHICILQENDNIKRDVASSDLVAYYDEGNMEDLNELLMINTPHVMTSNTAKANLYLLSTGATAEEIAALLPLVV